MVRAGRSDTSCVRVWLARLLPARFAEEFSNNNYSRVTPNSEKVFITTSPTYYYFLDTNNFIDYAHEGTGFPTWHRLFLLWLEREIQIQINDHTFRLPYWDWSDPSQREILFTRDRLGENVNGLVVGDLFNNWNTYCWKDTSGMKYPIPICDPTVPSGENLRRCPHNELCKMNNSNWPSTSDVKHAVSIKTYDSSPYNRYVRGTDTSFRNYMEGFVVKNGGCGSDTFCSPGNPSITRKLHNTVNT